MPTIYARAQPKGITVEGRAEHNNALDNALKRMGLDRYRKMMVKAI